MSERDLSVVIGELADVQARLAAAPENDFGGRAGLRSRRDALRAEAAELRSATPLDALDEAELRARLQRLEEQRDRHLSTHVTASAAAQTGHGGGIDPEYVHQLHRQMDEAAGLEAIEEEIRRIRNALGGAG